MEITSKVIVPLYSDLKKYSDSIGNETHILMDTDYACSLTFRRLEKNFSSNCDEILLFSHFNDAGFIEHFPTIRGHLLEFSKIKNEYLNFLNTNVPKFIDLYSIKFHYKVEFDHFYSDGLNESYNLFQNIFHFKYCPNQTTHTKVNETVQKRIKNAKKMQLENEEFKLAITKMQEYDKELLGIMSEIKANVENLLDKWEEKYYIMRSIIVFAETKSIDLD